MTLMQFYVGDTHFYRAEWNSSNVNETILEAPFRVNVRFHSRVRRMADEDDGLDFPATLDEHKPQKWSKPSLPQHDDQHMRHHSISKRCAGIGLMGALLPMLLMGLSSLLYSRLLMGGFGNAWGGGRWILIPIYYYDNYGIIYPDYYYYYYYPSRNQNQPRQYVYVDYLTRQQRQQRRVQPLNQQRARVVYVPAALHGDKAAPVFITDGQNHTSDDQHLANVNRPQIDAANLQLKHDPSGAPGKSGPSRDSPELANANGPSQPSRGKALFIEGQHTEEVQRAAASRQQRVIYVQQPQQPARSGQPQRPSSAAMRPNSVQPQQQQQQANFKRPAPGNRKQYQRTRAAQPLLRERTPQKAQATGVARSYVYSPPKVKMAKGQDSNGQYSELVRSPQKSYLIRSNKNGGGNTRRQTSWLG